MRDFLCLHPLKFSFSSYPSSTHLGQGPKPAGPVRVAHHRLPQLRAERFDRPLFERVAFVGPPLQRPPHEPHVLKHHGKGVVVLR